jgi:RNA polymerase sigma factor (TIGR02999 family)
MLDITQLLKAASEGDADAGGRVVAALYDDLRRQARRHLRQSGTMTLLDTTALVHEAWLRVSDGQGREYPGRRQFLAYVSRAMRSVVIDLARARQAERRGGGVGVLTLDTAVAEQLPQPVDDVLQVHEALHDLAEAEPRLAQVVEMRYFAGLAERDIAAALGVTERTVQRDWQKARLFLASSLRR